jgi:hypothetical protein
MAHWRQTIDIATAGVDVGGHSSLFPFFAACWHAGLTKMGDRQSAAKPIADVLLHIEPSEPSVLKFALLVSES